MSGNLDSCIEASDGTVFMHDNNEIQNKNQNKPHKQLTVLFLIYI